MTDARPSADPKSAETCFQPVAYGRHFGPLPAGFVTSSGPTRRSPGNGLTITDSGGRSGREIATRLRIRPRGQCRSCGQNQIGEFSRSAGAASLQKIGDATWLYPRMQFSDILRMRAASLQTAPIRTAIAVSMQDLIANRHRGPFLRPVINRVRSRINVRGGTTDSIARGYRQRSRDKCQSGDFTQHFTLLYIRGIRTHNPPDSLPHSSLDYSRTDCDRNVMNVCKTKVCTRQKG